FPYTTLFRSPVFSVTSSCSSVRPMRSTIFNRRSRVSISGGTSVSTMLPSASRRASRSSHGTVRTKPCAGTSLLCPCLEKYGQHTGAPPRIGVGGCLALGESHITSWPPLGTNDSSWPPNTLMAAVENGVSTFHAVKPLKSPVLRPCTSFIETLLPTIGDWTSCG